MRCFLQHVVLATVLLVSLSYAEEKSANPGDVPDKDYRLVYVADTWEDARKFCQSDGGDLAVPTTQEEFKRLQKIFRGINYSPLNATSTKRVVWVGINNLKDPKIWRNLQDEDINETGFHNWASTTSNSDNPREPHCAVIDAVNPGLRDWWCHHRLGYICENKLTDT